MSVSDIDDKTFESLFSHYAQFCEPWEVSFCDGATTKSPHDWLSTLDSATLSAPICEIHGDYTGTSYTAAVKRFLRTSRVTFRISWHPERHGWEDPVSAGSKVIHYFVPRAWMIDPPYTSEGMLIALCKRNWISNNAPFYPIDPQKNLCKTCVKHHENWNNPSA